MTCIDSYRQCKAVYHVLCSSGIWLFDYSSSSFSTCDWCPFFWLQCIAYDAKIEPSAGLSAGESLYRRACNWLGSSDEETGQLQDRWLLTFPHRCFLCLLRSLWWFFNKRLWLYHARSICFSVSPVQVILYYRLDVRPFSKCLPMLNPFSHGNVLPLLWQLMLFLVIVALFTSFVLLGYLPYFLTNSTKSSTTLLGIFSLWWSP